MCKNTKFCYIYRDETNFKENHEVIFPGEITEEQKEKIKECCEEGRFFVPRKIGLPEIRFNEITDLDTIWFEVLDFEYTTEEANMDMTLECLVEEFKKNQHDWENIEFPTETIYL